MIANFYTTTAENIYADKRTKLVSRGSGECSMMNTSILNPDIKVSASFKDCNYVYLPAFSRYYYVTDVDTLPGEHAVLKCHVDVLTTYFDDYKNSDQLILRQEDIEKWNNDFVDNSIPLLASKEVYGESFGARVYDSTKSLEYVILGVF